MTATVQPEKILRDLRELWDQLGREQETAGGVLRACAMTLLVVARDEADAENVRQTLGVLMHSHPSRAVVLRIGAGSGLDARVFAECWKPFGSNHQICAEGVEVTAAAEQLTDLTRFLIPLLVPDLPVVLWCRGERAFTSRMLEPLFPLAEKIILDSGVAPDAQAALDALKNLRKQGRRVADLAWTRLTGWREVLANLFAEGMLPAGTISSVQITHGGAKPSSSVLYFAKWIGRALPSATASLGAAEGDPGVRAVTLSGGGADVSVKLTDGTCIEARSGGRSYRTMLPETSDEALMHEELVIVGDDPAFDRVLLQ